MDPNRAFDIVLDSFEHQLHQEDKFYQYITLFNIQVLKDILGFKFQYYQQRAKQADELESAAAATAAASAAAAAAAAAPASSSNSLIFAPPSPPPAPAPANDPESKAQQEMVAALREDAPRSLYILTAMLIKNKMLKLTEIYPHVCICYLLFA
jgi:hypothetical protein